MDNPVHLACPHCGAINRIPAARRHDQPNCGKCKQPLFTGQPVELSDASFQRFIQKTDLPVVVDFWAPWCGPCKMMAPIFEQAAGQLEPDVRLAKLNTEQHQQVAGQLGIRSIPTLMLFKGGRPVAQQAGAMPLDQLMHWIRSNL